MVIGLQLEVSSAVHNQDQIYFVQYTIVHANTQQFQRSASSPVRCVYVCVL